MIMENNLPIEFSCYPEGYLQYEVKPGVFEYYLGYQVPVFNQICTLATLIDDTMEDFDIIPQVKFFTSVDKVTFLGEPDTFFNSDERFNLLISLRDYIDPKYGLLPMVAIISEYERNPSDGFDHIKTRTYSSYVQQIEKLLLEKNTPFSL